MCKLSIVISMSDYENTLTKGLDSLKNQTLKEIEILAISNHESSIKDSSINIYDTINHAVPKINGEYILFMDETDYLNENACELLYYQAKNNDLDLLYVPIIDENFEENKFGDNENSQQINQFNFTQICKKNILNDLSYSDNLFYEIQRNSKKFDIAKQKICFRSYISQNTIEKFTKEYLDLFPEKPDTLFTTLHNYLINYPLNLNQYFYDIIKTYFKNYNLNEKNQEIYNLISNNENLIDFLSEYKLYDLNFEVYENPLSKNNDYKISVIIPIFNNETLIHRTLMSIENQTLGIENVEVLMINDASTDNTKQVINRYVDKYPNFKAVHISNGTGSAGTPRNLGLRLASSKYILFIDHDDFLEINALEKLYNKITEYDCDFVYGTYVLINPEKSIKFTYPHEKHGFFKNLEDNPRSITIPPSIWTKLFKKDFLEKNNILFPTILGEDAIFMAKALKNANGAYYLWENIITYYNLNESSYSTNLSYTYFIEGFTSEEYLYNLFSDWGQIGYYKIRGEGILDFYLNRILYSNLSNNEISDIFPALHKFCDRLKELHVNPKIEKNKNAFEYIINNDLKGFLKFKNYKPSRFKVVSNKILNKINKHGFW